MTRDQALALAHGALDEMDGHPEVWLTHGRPSVTKAGTIVGIIANTILKAVSAKEEAEGWRDIAAKLGKMFPQPMPEPKRFKVGDRVRIDVIGRQGVIEAIVDGQLCIDCGDGWASWPSNQVEPI